MRRQKHAVMFELHIRREARIKYIADEALFESTGNVVFPNFRAVRELAHAINVTRGTAGDPANEIRAGYLNAAGLLDEIGHFLIRLYDEEENPGVLDRAYRAAERALGKKELESILLAFLEEFPPKAVYKLQQTTAEYFAASTNGRPHAVIALEELVMMFLSNQNPAAVRLKELFDDSRLSERTRYNDLITTLEKFFAAEKPFGPDEQPLLTALKKPMTEFPDSLEAQLGYWKNRWGIKLSAKFVDRIHSSFTFSKEEEQFVWNAHNPFWGTPIRETLVPEFGSMRHLSPEERRELVRKGLVKPEDYIYAEPEQFTPDTEWMPNVVLIAKNTYVWLDQLSKKYKREIKRLDQIPDEELDQLSRWHFTSLWLIGVWERSSASKRIKQITGNLDAVSSAYSLYDYEIARDLGGEEAFRHLDHRCRQRGIRLAGDMVPNHMGIFSKWVIEHPEYFVQSDRPPYPNYRFTGENLSEDPSIELRIEDGYWSRSDAAVVFQRIDRRSGDIRYIYHGIVGTSMPWNDTAQMNLLLRDVREAVIQNIFHVARKFSVIRFDAAMTLAKKHFQRLWYPMPGTSGVPSRQDHSLTRSEFDALFPNEFWREVVDRFTAEMPQTLLLAEAFWLMEGYFVRTLGMHRVYNSAFMHMLMKEENEKFRAMIKNTIEFNPEILKRYVNFMSNPDEQTAVEQFGKEDKYFGVATLMVTLPGLPMFAHGQMEGFTEKYGMEYQRAYYNETPDEWLIRRHEQEIFPLTQKRYLFSQVHDFEFYDFLDTRGSVNQNVIAYSNRAGEERAVVFFHNTFAECSGTIKYSLQKSAGAEGNLRSVSVAQSFGLHYSPDVYYRFKERSSNLEYLRSGKDLYENGITVHLRAFEYKVFMDFREMHDTDGNLRRIAGQLAGNGTRDLNQLLQKMKLHPLHRAMIGSFPPNEEKVRNERYREFLHELQKLTASTADTAMMFNAFIDRNARLSDLLTDAVLPAPKRSRAAKKPADVPLHFATIAPLAALCLDLHAISTGSNGAEPKGDLFHRFQLSEVFQEICTAQLIDRNEAGNVVSLVKNLFRHHAAIADEAVPVEQLVEMAVNDFDTASFLGVNQHNSVWYLHKEQLDLFIHCSLLLRFWWRGKSDGVQGDDTQILLRNFRERAERSGYVVERLKEILAEPVAVKKVAKKITKKGNRKKKSSAPRTKNRRTAAGSTKRGTTKRVKNVTKKRKKRGAR